MTKLPSLKWIAATGVIADHGEEDCKDLLDGFTKKSIATLTILSEAIAAAKAVNRINGIREAFDIFVKANEPKEVFNSPLIRYVDIFKQELERLESDFRENATFFSKTNAILYEVRSKYQITSSLANSIADKRSDEVIILLRCGKMLKVSARCMSGRVDVAKLLHDLVKNIGVGGGHEKAAGAAVPARHAEEFMQRLHEKLEFGF
jgi:single-stranded DNA-specific DHH superfamily exonuclease